MWNDVSKLAELLKPDEEDTTATEEGTHTIVHPGNIGQSSSASTKSYDTNPVENVQETKSIWNVEEVADTTDFPDDDRPEPQYDIVYKQSVSANDVFLGMDFEKDPSVHSCEAMVVRISLPKTKLKDIDLEVTANWVRVLCPSYKLLLHLPRPVHDDRGSAKLQDEKLILTLPFQDNKRVGLL